MINTVNIFISLAVLWIGTFFTNDVSGEDSLSYVAAVYEHKPSMLYLTGGDAWEDIENNLQIYEEQIKVAAAKVRHIIKRPLKRGCLLFSPPVFSLPLLLSSIGVEKCFDRHKFHLLSRSHDQILKKLLPFHKISSENTRCRSTKFGMNIPNIRI